MSTLRRRVAAGVAVLACAAPFGVAQAQDATRDKDNLAVATTEPDGARAFDFSYSVEYQRGGVVDHKNIANAAARCTDCRATAIAFQIVLVNGSPTQLVPHNQAVAINDQCTNCVVYAGARQFVRTVSDGHAHHARGPLHALRRAPRSRRPRGPGSRRRRPHGGGRGAGGPRAAGADRGAVHEERQAQHHPPARRQPARRQLVRQRAPHGHRDWPCRRAPARAPRTLPPRLADGVELLGEFEDSGFENPPHLARRADGQVIQLTELLHLVAEAADGERDEAQIADVVSEGFGRRVSADNIRFLVEKKLRPLGVLAAADGSSPRLRKADPLLALKYRTALVPAPAVQRLARVFGWLFSPLVLVLALGALVAFDVWLLFEHGVAASLRSALYEPVIMLGLFARGHRRDRLARDRPRHRLPLRRRAGPACSAPASTSSGRPSTATSPTPTG